MSDEQFRALLNLYMCSDPWPASPEDQETVLDLLNEQSIDRGYLDWTEAYHEHEADQPAPPGR